MSQKSILNIGILILTALSAQVSAEMDARVSKLVQTYCVTCHNENLKTANLMLDQAITGDIDYSPATWEKVVRRLKARSMPPIGMPRPEENEYRFFIDHLETGLDRYAEANPNPGRSVPHRLNRAEYANSVRDILDIEINVEELLPNDPASGHGFDNIADVLTLSPLLMERYITAAKSISQLAVGNPEQPAEVKTYLLPDNLDQDGRVDDDLPFASRGGSAFQHYFPVDGEYVIRVRLNSIPVGIYAGLIDGFAKPQQLDVRLDNKLVERFSVGGDEQDAVVLEARTKVKAGMRNVGVSFLRDTTKAEVIRKYRLDGEYGGATVELIEVDGPHTITGLGDTPSRQKIFSCQPTRTSEETACAKQIITDLATLAYRRPATNVDVQRLTKLYEAGREQGNFESAIALAIQGILISPDFLFRVEKDPDGIDPGVAYTINDLEFASRLSFFQWSSVPDQELLTLATEGRLRDQAVLEKQLQRMLADPKSQALTRNFASQWLHVRNLDLLSPPDPAFFPKYNANLKAGFKTEIELLFDHVIEEDRSILDFLSSDYSFLNEQLAEHYGIEGVYGTHFRKVALPDEKRWGLLGKGAVLTVTSYATRTSPTLRGKWVLSNILGTPPPPPPPDIPSLKNDPVSAKMSMRDRMERHRNNPVCASCHSLMDPLGLALENFDGIGAYRALNTDKKPIDASGVLPNGTEFSGVAELRKALLDGEEQFIGTFVERMLIYALGRGLEYYDMRAVREIIRESAKQDYHWSSVVMQVVQSQPFQMRRSAENDDI
jgi:hypothetical protein